MLFISDITYPSLLHCFGCRMPSFHHNSMVYLKVYIHTDPNTFMLMPLSGPLTYIFVVEPSSFQSVVICFGIHFSRTTVTCILPSICTAELLTIIYLITNTIVQVMNCTHTSKSVLHILYGNQQRTFA